MDTENTTVNENPTGKTLRLLRPSVVVLCGPAGAGKSHFAEHHFRPTQVISSDWARARVCDDERDQRYNTQAFALLNFLLEQRLSVNRLCVVDSTALTAAARRDLLALCKRFSVPATMIVFDVPLETCVERDAKRERSVGRPVIERQYQTFLESKEGFEKEGFAQVVRLSDADVEQIRIEVLFRPVLHPEQHSERDARHEHFHRGLRPQASLPAVNKSASRPPRWAATHGGARPGPASPPPARPTPATVAGRPPVGTPAGPAENAAAPPAPAPAQGKP